MLWQPCFVLCIKHYKNYQVRGLDALWQLDLWLRLYHAIILAFVLFVLAQLSVSQESEKNGLLATVSGQISITQNCISLVPALSLFLRAASVRNMISDSDSMGNHDHSYSEPDF